MVLLLLYVFAAALAPETSEERALFGERSSVCVFLWLPNNLFCSASCIHWQMFPALGIYPLKGNRCEAFKNACCKRRRAHWQKNSALFFSSRNLYVHIETKNCGKDKGFNLCKKKKIENVHCVILEEVYILLYFFSMSFWVPLKGVVCC